jgi:mRNA interferase RelE/StbE
LPKTEVAWTEDALEDLEKLDPSIRKRIIRKISWFSEHFNNQTPEPLSGQLSGDFKIRIGDWRVIYQLEEEVIVIYAIGHRKDVYKY